LSLRSLERVIREGDVVLEVVDSRAPERFRCPEIENLARRLGKPIVLCLNKCDLVPKDVVEQWKRFLRKHFDEVVFTSARDHHGTIILRRAIRKVSRGKRPVKVSVVGYPNVGKSSIINALKGRRSSPVSSIPGYTRKEMELDAKGGIRVLDTPGVFPQREDKDAYLRGTIDPDKLKDPVKGAIEVIREVKDKMPGALRERYQIDENLDPIEFLELLGRKRGRFTKGGEVDLERVAKELIREFHVGKIRYYILPGDEFANRRILP